MFQMQAKGPYGQKLPQEPRGNDMSGGHHSCSDYYSANNGSAGFSTNLIDNVPSIEVFLCNTSLLQFLTLTYTTQGKTVKTLFTDFYKSTIYLLDKRARTDQEILQSYSLTLGTALRIPLTTKVSSGGNEQDLHTLVDLGAT